MTVVSLPNLRDLRRLLIIRLSSIGDVTHALPIAAALGEAFPHLEITWVVEEMSAEIVTGCPYLHEALIIPRSRWKRGRLRSPRVWREYLAFLSDLRRRRFDVTLDLQGYAKSGLLALATGAPYRFGWWRLRDGAGLVSHALTHRREGAHRVEWFLDVARALGAEPETVRFPLHIPEAARTRARELLRAGGVPPEAPYAVLNPAVGNEVRRWGAARYAELAVRLADTNGLFPVLIGSGKDAPICEEVVARAKSEAEARGKTSLPSPLSLAGQTSLKELAAVLEGCAVHICGDTGSAHIAAALERPVIALYGPTDPAHAGPWNQSRNVLSHRELCRTDCTERRCAVAALPQREGNGETAKWGNEETARCLAVITPEDVVRKVGQVVYGE